MRKIFIILIMAVMASGCVAGRDVGRFVENTIGTMPQKVVSVGSPSRGSQISKLYPSGEYAFSRDKRHFPIDGFADLQVASEYSDGSNDFIFLTGTTRDGSKKSLLIVSPYSVSATGFFEIPEYSPRPIEVKKEKGVIQFVQEHASGAAYIVHAYNPNRPNTLETFGVPKGDVRPSATAVAAPAKSAGVATAKAPQPAAAPQRSAYGIELPPLDAYTPTTIDRSGKAKVDTTKTSQTAGSKPQIVLD